MLTLSHAWRGVMEASGVKPIYLVTLELGPAAYLTITGYSNGAGDTVGIRTVAGGSVVGLVGGTDFALGASNAECATNICTAINAHPTLSLLMYAASRDNVITLIAINNSFTFLEFTTTDTTAWNIIIPRMPQLIGAVTGDYPLWPYPNSIAHIAPIASSKDITTQKVSIGDVEITFKDDGYLRYFLSRARVKGRRVTITLGMDRLAYSQWAPCGVYTIDDFSPDYSSISLNCVEPIAQAMDAKITGTATIDSYHDFLNVHPLTAIRRILELAYVPSDIIDLDSLDSTDARYSEVSHWGVSRCDAAGFKANLGYTTTYAADNSITESIVAKDLIDDLSNIMDGALYVDESGTYKFSMYDSSIGIVKQLDVSSITDFEQLSTLDNVFNSIGVAGIADSAYSNGEAFTFFRRVDTLSRLLAGLPATPRELDLTVQSNWLGRWATVFDMFQNAPDEIGVRGLYSAPISGTRQNSTFTFFPGYDNPSQRDEDALLDGRTATLLLIAEDGSKYEYIEVDEFFFFDRSSWSLVSNNDLAKLTPTPSTGYFADPQIAATTIGPEYCNLDVGYFRVANFGRGLYGSTEQTWGSEQVRVYDVTIAVRLTLARLNRFSNGCPIIKFRTTLNNIDLQIGDFITVSHPVYLNFNKDGADTQVVWEIISKEIATTEDSPGIVLTCAWVRDDVSLVAISVNRPPSTPSFPSSLADVVTDNNGVFVTDATFDFVLRG